MESTNHEPLDGAKAMLPYEHTLKYTEGSKVEFMRVENVSYPAGIYSVMQAFYQEIHTIEVVFLVIQYESAELLIAWQMAGIEGELELWRALDKLRKGVASTCMACGNKAHKECNRGSIITMCTSCKLEQMADPNDTGTWLDKY